LKCFTNVTPLIIYRTTVNYLHSDNDIKKCIFTSVANWFVTCREVHRESGFFHGLLLTEHDNCKANSIEVNRNFQSTKNKKYFEDGALNRKNVNWKTRIHIHKGWAKLLKGKIRTLSNTFKQPMDDLQINFYNDKLRTKNNILHILFHIYKNIKW